MRYRKLRIAWSVGWGLAVVLFVGLGDRRLGKKAIGLSDRVWVIKE